MHARISRAVAILLTGLLAVGGILVTPMAASAADGDAVPISATITGDHGKALVTALYTLDGSSFSVYSTAVMPDASGFVSFDATVDSTMSLRLLVSAVGHEDSFGETFTLTDSGHHEEIAVGAALPGISALVTASGTPTQATASLSLDGEPVATTTADVRGNLFFPTDSSGRYTIVVSNTGYDDLTQEFDFDGTTTMLILDLTLTQTTFTVTVDTTFSAETSSTIFATLGDSAEQQISGSGFTFPDLTEGVYTLSVHDSTEAYSGYSTDIAVYGDTTQHVDLLRADGTNWADNATSGTIVDQNGNLVPFGTVTFSSSNGEFASSIANGSYSVPRLPADDLLMTVEAAGYETGTTVVHGGDSPIVDYALVKSSEPSTTSLRGTVYGDHSGIPEATIEIAGSENPGPGESTQHTADQYGNFDIAADDLGSNDPFWVRATAPGWLPSAWMPMELGNGAYPLDITLEARTAIRGTVIDENEVPVASGTVEVFAADELSYLAASGPITDGAYDVALPGSGRYVVRFSAPGFRTQVFAVGFTDELAAGDVLQIFGSSGLDMQLQSVAPQPVSGKVRFADRTLQQTTIVLDRHDDATDTWHEAGVVETDSLGGYSFPSVEPGSYRVTAAAGTYSLTRKLFTVANAPVAVPLLLLSQPTAIQYLTVDPHDAESGEMLYALTTVYRQIGADRWAPVAAAEGFASIALRDDTAYRVLSTALYSNHKPSTGSGWFQGDITADATAVPVTKLAGQGATVRVDLEPGGRSSGVVRYYGTPVAGATVNVGNQSGYSEIPTYSDGSFDAGFLPAGEVLVRISAPGYDTVDWTPYESLGWNGQLDLQLELTHKHSLAITGSVTNQFGAGITTATVELSQNGEVLQTADAIDATFAFTVTEAGIYQLSTSALGSSVSTSVQVDPDALNTQLILNEPDAIQPTEPIVVTDDPELPPTPPTVPAAYVGQPVSLPAFNWTNGWQDAGISWLMDGAVASTDPSYTPVAADLGGELTAEVYASTSAFGNVYSVAFAVSGSVVGAGMISVPSVSLGYEWSGTYVIANVDYADLPADATVTYTWLRNGEPFEHDSDVYEPTDIDHGTTLAYVVSVTAPGYLTPTPGSGSIYIPYYEWPELPATGTVSIWDNGGGQYYLIPADWPTEGFTTQWLLDGVAIDGATDYAVDIAKADLGKTLTVRLTLAGTPAGYAPVSALSEPLVTRLLNLDWPTLGYTGELTLGSTLTGDIGTWIDGATVEPRWERVVGGERVVIDAGLTHELVAADFGRTLYFVASGSIVGYNPTAPELAVEVPALGEFTVSGSTISGEKSVGSTLTANLGEQNPGGLDLTVWWTRDGETIDTGLTHVVSDADRNGYLELWVSAEGAGYTCDVCLNSVASVVIPPAQFTTVSQPTIVVSGDGAVPGTELTLDIPQWSPEPTSYSIYWYNENGDIIGAGPTYLITVADLGHTVRAYVGGILQGYSASWQVTSLYLEHLWREAPELTISGTAEVGSLLTADAHGYDTSAGTITWKRGDVVVGHDDSYTVDANDRTSVITVTYDEPVTADGCRALSVTAASDVVPGLEITKGTATVEGSLTYGFTLTGATLGWADDVATELMWTTDYSDAVVSGASYQLSEIDLGHTVHFTVTATSPLHIPTSIQVDTYIPIGAIEQGTPTITGTAAPGETLTGTAVDVSIANAAIGGTWSIGSHIVGTESTYLVQPEDRGATIAYTSTASWAPYFGASVASTTIVIPLGTIAAGTPTISGTTTIGSVLTATTGTWPTDATLTTRWLRNGVAISGDTGLTHTIVPADQGGNVTFEVVAAAPYSAATTVSVTAAIPAAVVAPVTVDRVVDPVVERVVEVTVEKVTTVTVTIYGFTATPTPVIAGKAVVGKTLTAKPGAWKPSGATLAYQWYANGKAIAGATSSKLKLAASVKGKKITVRVTGSKAGYTIATVTSKATGKVKK